MKKNEKVVCDLRGILLRLGWRRCRSLSPSRANEANKKKYCMCSTWSILSRSEQNAFIRLFPLRLVLIHPAERRKPHCERGGSGDVRTMRPSLNISTTKLRHFATLSCWYHIAFQTRFEQIAAVSFLPSFHLNMYTLPCVVMGLDAHIMREFWTKPSARPFPRICRKRRAFHMVPATSLQSSSTGAKASFSGGNFLLLTITPKSLDISRNRGTKSRRMAFHSFISNSNRCPGRAWRKYGGLL